MCVKNMARVLRPLFPRSLYPHTQFSLTRYILSNFDRIQIKYIFNNVGKRHRIKYLRGRRGLWFININPIL